jgi:Flp pilus assembly pilin Flp
MRIATKTAAQGMIEYALIAACVVAVFVSMRVYIRGGIASKYRDTVSSTFGGQFDPAQGVFMASAASGGSSVSDTTFKVYNDSDGKRAFALLSYQSAGEQMAVSDDGNVSYSGSATIPSAGLTSMNTEYSAYAFENGTALQ